MSYRCEEVFKSNQGMVILSTFGYPDNEPICKLILDSDNNQAALASITGDELIVGYNLGFFNIEKGGKPPKASMFNLPKNSLVYLTPKGEFNESFNLGTDNDGLFYPDVTVYMPASYGKKFVFELTLRYFYGTTTVMMEGDRLEC